MASLIVNSYSHVWQGTAFAILAILFNISLMNTDQAQKNVEIKSRSDTIRTNSNFEALQVTTHIPSGSPHSCLKVRIKGEKTWQHFKPGKALVLAGSVLEKRFQEQKYFQRYLFFENLKHNLPNWRGRGRGKIIFINGIFNWPNILRFLTSSLIMTDLLRPPIKKDPAFSKTTLLS